MFELQLYFALIILLSTLWIDNYYVLIMHCVPIPLAEHSRGENVQYYVPTVFLCWQTEHSQQQQDENQ